jgi:tetratricopeptide (TPR) repeat protein
LYYHTAMNLVDCYQRLGLKLGASTEEIKQSYRRLARQYHPDVNPNDLQAKEKFIALTAAYQYVLEFANSRAGASPPTSSPATTSVSSGPFSSSSSRPSAARPQVKVKTQVRQEPTASPPPEISAADRQLKLDLFRQLQDLLKQQRYPRAITLIEGLAYRLPHDQEIRQWQAITYQRLGRHLIHQREIDKARLYLKKALSTDPHNQSLWVEVEQDFRRIEQLS